MTMAVTESVARGSRPCCARPPATPRRRRGLYRPPGITCAVPDPAGQDRDGQARPSGHTRQDHFQIDGNFDDCLELARKLTADFPTIAPGQNSVNPCASRDQKTAAFGIVDALGTARCAFLPVGNAGNITTGAGYTEYHRDGVVGDRLPRMLGTRPPAPSPGAGASLSRNPNALPRPRPDRVRRRPGTFGRRGPAAVQRPLSGGHRREIPRRTTWSPVLKAFSSELASRPASPGLLKSIEGRLVKPEVSMVVCTGHRQRPQGSGHCAQGHARQSPVAGGSPWRPSLTWSSKRIGDSATLPVDRLGPPSRRQRQPGAWTASVSGWRWVSTMKSSSRQQNPARSRRLRAPAPAQVPHAPHLVVRAIPSRPGRRGVLRAGSDLRCRNDIPHSRGLGSSAAAVVGAWPAEMALSRKLGLEPLTEARLIQLSRIEGILDNAAAAVLGGAVVSWTETVHDSPANRRGGASSACTPTFISSRPSRSPFVDRRDPRAAAPGQPRSTPVQRQPRRPAGDRLSERPDPADGSHRGRTAPIAAGAACRLGGISAGPAALSNPSGAIRRRPVRSGPDLSPYQPDEALEFGIANGFTLSEMNVG